MKLFQDLIFKLIFILCYREYNRELYDASSAASLQQISHLCITRFIFSSFSISGSQASALRKLKWNQKESIRIGETEGTLTMMVEDLGGTILSISAFLFLCLSFLSISLSFLRVTIFFFFSG